MQSRQNIAKTAFEIIAEEARRLYINKSADALRNMPAREILTSKVVEHINSYYKLGENDYIHFSYKEDEARLKIDDQKIIFNENEARDNSFVWVINFIHDYENFCRKLPFWSLTLSIQKNNETIFSILQNPIIDILIFSEKGSGSVNNQRKVRAVSSSIDKIIGKSKNISIPNSLSSSKVLSLNSISIELVYLCLGIIDYYLISNDDYIKNQDCLLIAKEAGILVNKFDDFFVLANEKNMSNL